MTLECQENSLIHATSLETVLLECILKCLFIVALFAYLSEDIFYVIYIIKSLHIIKINKTLPTNSS